MTMNENPDNTGTEQEFLKQYDMSKYPSVAYTSDLLIFTLKEGALALLMVKRGGHPFKGTWALPGGFVNPSEDSETAAIRELAEETGIDLSGSGEGYLEQLKTYSTPGRDPRGRVISTAYIALLPNVQDPEAGDDATEARFFAVDDLLGENAEFPLAFDHESIIRDGLQRVRDKIEWSPLATTFLHGPFTMGDLRRVYETVWGSSVHAANFRRKVQSVPGFVIPLNQKGDSQFEGGRSADLYKAGDAKMLFPPILRKGADSLTEEDGD